MSTVLPEFRVTKLTVPEYLALAEAGVFGDRRVELLEGWVVDQMPHGPIPVTLIMWLGDWLASRLPSGTSHRNQMPIQLADSCPYPDLAVVSGQFKDYMRRHPTAHETHLVIEVADSTLDDDRSLKGRIYARAGLPEFWIVNCDDRQIEIYTEPTAATDPPCYQRQEIFGLEQTVPVRIGGDLIGELPVSELFEDATT